MRLEEWREVVSLGDPNIHNRFASWKGLGGQSLLADERAGIRGRCETYRVVLIARIPATASPRGRPSLASLSVQRIFEDKGLQRIFDPP